MFFTIVNSSSAVQICIYKQNFIYSNAMYISINNSITNNRTFIFTHL